MKDIKVVVEKMTRNRRKMIGKPADSLLCPLHSIQFSTLVYFVLYAYDGQNFHGVPEKLNIYAVTCRVQIDSEIKKWYINFDSRISVNFGNS